MWLLISCIAFSAIAMERPVLIQNPDTSNLEYEAHLQAGGRYLSPTQAYRKAHPSLADREKLLASYADAQRAFLDGNRNAAQKAFEKVFELWSTNDWGHEDQNIFIHTTLRLAQIAEHPARRDEWLKKVLLFDARLQADPKLFPPPLMKDLRELRRRSHFFYLPETLAKSSFEEILINGTPCLTAICPVYTNNAQPVRVTFLSNKFLPQTLLLKLTEIKHAMPAKIPWVDGTCGTLTARANKELSAPKVVFNGNICADRNAKIDLQPQSHPLTNDLPITQPRPTLAKKFYESPWFWGATGLVTAVLAYASTHSKQDTHPSTTYGF